MYIIVDVNFNFIYSGFDTSIIIFIVNLTPNPNLPEIISLIINLFYLIFFLL